MLRDVAIANVLLSIVLALWSVLDVNRRPPAMSIMKWVWPFTFLWGGLLALVMYLWFGRSPLVTHPPEHDQMHHHGHGHQRKFWHSVSLGATHCGAGCTLADLLTESAMYLFGINFVVSGHAVFGNWIVDYIMALIIGVIFQYGAQAPMSNAPRSTVWWQSFKSDVLSLTSWQIGMYGWMAICIFVLFSHSVMRPDHWTFWWMMQIAMLCGFLTAFPTNWALIKVGIKEAM